MAINIIRNGIERENPRHEAMCGTCGCVFTYQDSDTIQEPTGRYYKDFEEYFIKMDDCDRKEIAVFIDCPWCGHRIHLQDKYVKI